MGPPPQKNGELQTSAPTKATNTHPIGGFYRANDRVSRKWTGRKTGETKTKQKTSQSPAGGCKPPPPPPPKPQGVPCRVFETPLPQIPIDRPRIDRSAPGGRRRKLKALPGTSRRRVVRNPKEIDARGKTWKKTPGKLPQVAFCLHEPPPNC